MSKGPTFNILSYFPIIYRSDLSKNIGLCWKQGNLNSLVERRLSLHFSLAPGPSLENLSCIYVPCASVIPNPTIQQFLKTSHSLVRLFTQIGADTICDIHGIG